MLICSPLFRPTSSSPPPASSSNDTCDAPASMPAKRGETGDCSADCTTTATGPARLVSSPISTLMARQRKMALLGPDEGPTMRSAPLVSLPIAVLLPALCSLLVFAVIPLGEPNEGAGQKRVWLLITNPITYMMLAFCITALFFASLDETVPWRRWTVYLAPVLGAYVVQCAVMGLVYPFTSTFPLMGLIPFVVCIASSIIILMLMRKYIWHCKCDFYSTQLRAYRRVVISIAIYVIILTFWVMIFRSSNRRSQIGLPFILFIFVFGWKKYLLWATEGVSFQACGGEGGDCISNDLLTAPPPHPRPPPPLCCQVSNSSKPQFPQHHCCDTSAKLE